MEWQVEWRRLALMHTLRPLAAAGCVVAALLPFGVAAWRQGIAPLVGLWPLLGLALALIAAGVLG